MSALTSSVHLAELLDALTDAVVAPPHPEGRAEVICQLLAEVAAMLAWRAGTNDRILTGQFPSRQVSTEPGTEELASFASVIAAAVEHHERMRCRPLDNQDDKPDLVRHTAADGRATGRRAGRM